MIVSPLKMVIALSSPFSVRVFPFLDHVPAPSPVSRIGKLSSPSIVIVVSIVVASVKLVPDRE